MKDTLKMVISDCKRSNLKIKTLLDADCYKQLLQLNQGTSHPFTGTVPIISSKYKNRKFAVTHDNRNKHSFGVYLLLFDVACNPAQNFHNYVTCHV